MSTQAKIRSVGIVGAGVMGAGVAQVLAQTGHRVILIDLTEGTLAAARLRIAQGLKLAALFDPGLRARSLNAVVEGIETDTDYGRLHDVDFLIENCTEDPEIKQKVLGRLDAICGPGCIFAANTSAIPIAFLAAATQRPDRCIGMHFMNPVPQSSTVEVIRGAQTSGATLEASLLLLEQMGKRAIVVGDAPGFVSNRIMMLAINEAIALVQEGTAGPEVVDAIFMDCMGHKMGPLATADLIGLDTVLHTLNVLHCHFEGGRYLPSRLLKEMVESGRHGRKTGRGFFFYGRVGQG